MASCCAPLAAANSAMSFFTPDFSINFAASFVLAVRANLPIPPPAAMERISSGCTKDISVDPMSASIPGL